MVGLAIEAWQGGVKVADTTTGAGGAYASSLKPGSYLICEKLPAGSGWIQSFPKAGDPGTPRPN